MFCIVVFARSSTVNHFVLFRQKYDCHRKFLILICWNLKKSSLLNVQIQIICNFDVFPFFRNFTFPLSPATLIPNLTIWVTWQGSDKKQEMLALREHLGLPRILCGSSLLIFFILSVMLRFFFLFFRPVSCVPIVASAFRLSILDWPFGFLKRLLSINVVKSSTEIH